jgi:hypothetical protein
MSCTLSPPPSFLPLPAVCQACAPPLSLSRLCADPAPAPAGLTKCIKCKGATRWDEGSLECKCNAGFGESPRKVSDVEFDDETCDCTGNNQYPGTGGHKAAEAQQ